MFTQLHDTFLSRIAGLTALETGEWSRAILAEGRHIVAELVQHGHEQLRHRSVRPNIVDYQPHSRGLVGSEAVVSHLSTKSRQ
jgi:hypothetical protein